MGMFRRFARFTTFVFGVGLFFVVMAPRAAEAAPHNVNGWAWSGTTGWISTNCNFDPTGCVGPAGDYGLDIDALGNVSGWAWSSLAGWICFGSTCNGAVGVPVTGTPSSPASAADHYCPGFVPCARYDTNDSQLHGWAYVISQTDGTNYRGWISLNCTDVGTNTASPHSCPGADYGVTFDEAATQPAGEFYGYSWNGNGDATGNGWLKFGCSQPHSSCAGADGPWGVKSGWVDSGWTTIAPIEGVYSPSVSSSTTTHLSDIPIAFSQFSAPAGSTLRCVFRMSNNTYRTRSVSISSRRARVAYTEYYTVSATSADSVVDASGNPVLWSFSSQAPDPPFGCEIQGVPSEQRVISNRVAVHPESWTFTGAAGANTIDSVRAKYCLDGNTNTDPTRAYFLNADPTGAVVQCDTEGDLAYTLLKARGVPVEVRCYDNIDNDANMQRDCAGGTPATVAERTCRGITYLCIPHPAATAPQPPRP
ncbi:MAG: hypothetical protein WC866_02420 [Patescibacteria group bacterium]|jgi:hypothetical protein